MTLEEDIELMLLRGSDIKIDKYITLKSYTIREIIDDIGYQNYISLMYYICNTPYEMRVQLYKENVLYSDLTHWELFIIFFKNGGKHDNNTLKVIFDKFLSLDISNYIYNKEKDILENKDNKHIIDNFKFSYMISILRSMVGLGNKKEPVFGNKTSMIYEIEREKRRIEKKRFINKATLKSIMSSLSWNSNLNLIQIWDLTLYQIYDGLNSKVKKDNYDNIMLGIYTGNVKSEDVNFDKEKWFNK